MQFLLLGPIEVWAEEYPVDLGRAASPKVLCMLAALLQEPGALLPSDVLVDRVWGDEAPGCSVRYKYVSWLRAALAPYGVQLTQRDNGYRLNVEAQDVDLHQFRRLTAEARTSARLNKADEVILKLRTALGMWRGPALAGLTGRWAERVHHQLEQERDAATELRLRASLELGQHAEVTTELASWHTERPCDETIAELFMLALYRTGRRAQALGVYDQTDEAIRQTLNTEPSPALRHLYERIRHNDTALMGSQLIIGDHLSQLPIPITSQPADADTPRLRVVIAEDSAVVRDGMAWLLDMRGHEVVASVGDPDALYSAVAEHDPDVAVVDVRMPPTYTDDGLRAAVELRRRYPNLGLLLFSQYIETSSATELLAAGARGVGYLLKDRVGDVAEFAAALVRVAMGGTVLDPEVVSHLMRAARNDRGIDNLTEREREVLALMAEGRSNGAIARKLVLSASAVDKNVSSIFAKLNLPASEDDHRRVLAVLRHLATEQSGPPTWEELLLPAQ